VPGGPSVVIRVRSRKVIPFKPVTWHRLNVEQRLNSRIFGGFNMN
jgi:hypothetical protein